MSADAPTCPYCNAQTPPEARGRVACPRCGEVYTTSGTGAPAHVAAAPSLTAGAGSAAVGKPVRANRLVAGVVLAVMTLMAAAGLTYALMTVQVRRGHDQALPRRPRKAIEYFRKPRPEPAEPVAPANLAGLGYLPAGTNVAAAVHVAELLASPAAAALREKGLPAGGGEWKLDALTEQLGVAPDEIDHLVLGAQLDAGQDRNLTPPAYLVVRTKAPYNAVRVRLALGAKRAAEVPAPDGGKRSLYAARLKKLPLPAQLWLADGQTFVLAFFSKLEDVPRQPAPGDARLQKELRQVLEQRLAGGAPAWLAGHSANWDKTLLPALLGGLKAVPGLDRLGQVQTFAVWLQLSTPAKVLGAFRCVDAAAARQVEQQELLRRKKTGANGPSLRRVGEWLDVEIQLPDPPAKQ
jgi:hypothetical protein